MTMVGLVLAAATQLVEQIQQGVVARGFDDVRPAHGFAFLRISRSGATVADLADHLGVTKQAASQLVEQLVQRGYLSRQQDPRDGRARLLRLTDRGQACTEAAERAAGEVIGRWREQLEPATFAALRDALQEVVQPGPVRPTW